MDLAQVEAHQSENLSVNTGNVFMDSFAEHLASASESDALTKVLGESAGAALVVVLQ